MRALSMVATEPGKYIHWGVIQISVANAAIIAAMVVVFILALVIPFPTGHGEDSDEQGRGR